MYYKLNDEIKEQYDSIMMEFFQALLPTDYQDHIDNEDCDALQYDEVPF